MAHQKPASDISLLTQSENLVIPMMKNWCLWKDVVALLETDMMSYQLKYSSKIQGIGMLCVMEFAKELEKKPEHAVARPADLISSC